MPPDAPLNSDAPSARVMGSLGRVAEMQAKLHRWAAAGKGRRFDDLFNFVCDPATLIVASGPGCRQSRGPDRCGQGQEHFL
jgi:RNA-directed DNA polymerase